MASEANAAGVRPGELCKYWMGLMARRIKNPMGVRRLVDRDQFGGMQIDIYEDVDGQMSYRINGGWTRGRTNRGLEELKGWDHGIHYESRRIFPDKFADAKPLEGLKVLDVGCGDGKLVHEFLEKNVKAYGLDLYLNEEQRRRPDLFKRGLAEKLPYDDNSFDVLYYNASAFLHGTVSREGYVAYLKEASRVLKPGGKIRISFVDGGLLSAAIQELPELNVSDMPTKIRSRTFEWNGKPWSTAGTGNGEWIFAELIKK